MKSSESSKEQEACSKNGYVDKDKHITYNKLLVSRKIHTHRNSLLTDLMQVNHLQTVHNMCLAGCINFLLGVIILYLLEPSKMWNDLAMVKFGASKFSYFVRFWLLFNFFAFAFYEGFKLWIAVRGKATKVADVIFLLLYIASFFLTYGVTAAAMLEIGFLPICGIAAGLEQTRIYMKIHSFVRESIPRVKHYKPQKDGNQQHVLYPTRKHYLYYLFAPTLIYRDTYPRLKNRQWRKVFYNFGKFFMSYLMMYCLLIPYYMDTLKETGAKLFTKREMTLIFTKTMANGTIMYFLAFYGLLHCWLNATAELLKFADKEFYQDWWNSTNYDQFYRKWNTVVGDWLNAYIYTDIRRLGCNNVASAIFTFFISAAFHEYCVTLALGFCYPVLFFLFFVLGIPAIFLTKGNTSQNWNVVMWCFMFFGTGVMIFLYTIEWYARINCPTKINFFKPKSWDPTCLILDFS